MGTRFATQKADTDAGFAAQKADMDAGFAAQRADMDAGFAAQRAETDRALAEQKTEITQLHTKYDALDRQLKFVLALLGLLFAMSAYNFLQPSPVAAPAHAEASQAAPAEPNRTPPIKPPKDTAPG